MITMYFDTHASKFVIVDPADINSPLNHEMAFNSSPPSTAYMRQ